MTEIAVHPGNAACYRAAKCIPDKNSPLKGLRLICLGSSVTYGYGSLGESFPEYLSRKDGVIILAKEAVNGTTLVTAGEDSYIPRMERLDRELDADAFICQLSTNDASAGYPLGSVSDGRKLQDFDTKTVAGAIEYIICYALSVWHCPVLFYTGTRYESPLYGQMVSLLLRIADKWQITVIDQWNDEALNSISDEERALYMLDGIHPAKAGYLKWWLPQFEKGLMEACHKKE